MATLHLDSQIRNGAGLSEAEHAIRDLDGEGSTSVIIELPRGRTLLIAGGPRNFVVECAENETDRWCVVDPTRNDVAIDIVAGGQLVNYPARVCVCLESALEAARVFIADDGGRSPRLVWSVET